MASLRVEVVDARADLQRLVVLRLEEGASVEDAVRASGLGERGVALGIGGRRVPADRRLVDGDRVEILRALLEDPKEARRRRARRMRRRGTGKG